MYRYIPVHVLNLINSFTTQLSYSSNFILRERCLLVFKPTCTLQCTPHHHHSLSLPSELLALSTACTATTSHYHHHHHGTGCRCAQLMPNEWSLSFRAYSNCRFTIALEVYSGNTN